MNEFVLNSLIGKRKVKKNKEIKEKRKLMSRKKGDTLCSGFSNGRIESRLNKRKAAVYEG
jgi:hypothetical protein